MKSVGFISAVIYTGISLAAAGLFLVGTLAGEYTLVERIGGLGWVFLLSMIILMPIITPLVKKRFETDQTGGLIEGGIIMAISIDPVCKMEVEESQAAATSEYKGKKYYFCAVGCKKAFEQDPEKYLAEEKK